MKSEKGITLIGLVVTILVIILLFSISITTITGENSVVTRAIKSKERYEIAEIEEKAGLVKMGLDIDEKVSQNRMKKYKLLNELNKAFEGSTLEKNRIILNNKNYDIIVKNDLEIIVVGKGEKYLKDGEIEILYYYDEECQKEEWETLPILLYPEIDGYYDSYEEYAQQILDSITETGEARNTILEQMFIEADKYYMISGGGMELTEDARLIKDFEEWMMYCASLGAFGENPTEIPQNIEEFKLIIFR